MRKQSERGWPVGSTTNRICESEQLRAGLTQCTVLPPPTPPRPPSTPVAVVPQSIGKKKERETVVERE